jgi:hypothetical protein
MSPGAKAAVIIMVLLAFVMAVGVFVSLILINKFGTTFQMLFLIFNCLNWYFSWHGKLAKIEFGSFWVWDFPQQSLEPPQLDLKTLLFMQQLKTSQPRETIQCIEY